MRCPATARAVRARRYTTTSVTRVSNSQARPAKTVNPVCSYITRVAMAMVARGEGIGPPGQLAEAQGDPGDGDQNIAAHGDELSRVDVVNLEMLVVDPHPHDVEGQQQVQDGGDHPQHPRDPRQWGRANVVCALCQAMASPVRPITMAKKETGK